MFVCPRELRLPGPASGLRSRTESLSELELFRYRYQYRKFIRSSLECSIVCRRVRKPIRYHHVREQNITVLFFYSVMLRPLTTGGGKSEWVTRQLQPTSVGPTYLQEYKCVSFRNQNRYREGKKGIGTSLVLTQDASLLPLTGCFTGSR